MAVSEREQLQKMAEESLSKRTQAAKDDAQAKQDNAQARAAMDEADEEKTKEILDVLKPIFDEFKLPETGQTLRVSLEKNNSKFFPDLKDDKLAKASIGMVHNGLGITLFIARSRRNVLWLSENHGGTLSYASLDQLKEHLINRVANFGRKEVLNVLHLCDIWE